MLLVKKSIETADFIAIDTEFSGKFYKFKFPIGYTEKLEDRGHDYDDVEERYQKIKYVCEKFVAF